MRGRIFDIQRFSIHDGPGIRTLVFLKGCPLRCLWCHNPEGINPDPELSFIPEKCIGCGYCFRACPRHAHEMIDGSHVLDRSKCTVCGACTEECYAGALELIGREVSVEEVMREVLSDRPFYETSGGGMTLSGGEPLMQIDFTEALLAAAKDVHVHCCVETCGYADFTCFERIIRYVDLFLYDVKEIDDDRHIEFTGVPTGKIIENLRRLHDAGASIRVRVPVIPGYNDREDTFRGIADLVKGLPNLEGVELMPYHHLGSDKRRRLDIDDEMPSDIQTPDDATIASWIDAFERCGVTVLNTRAEHSGAGARGRE